MTYNVRNDEIEAALRAKAKLIAADLPKGWGFALLLFTFGEGGSLFYIGNGDREDMIKAMKEFIARNTQ